MTEAVANLHPDYTARAPEWSLMRDAAWGESAVKDAGETYLPKPGGFKSQSDGGVAMYAAYKTRAGFPEIVSPAVLSMVGVIHQAEIKIDLPAGLEGMWERATADGLPLEAFHRRITAELLTTGRYAVLTDAPSTGSVPWLAGYQAESLINWSDDRTMFVLDESGLVRDGFSWEEKKQYLALLMEEGRYVGRRYDQAGNVIEGQEAQPTTARRETLAEIPLVVIGPRDLALKPETPPLIAIARSAKAMYQLSADYRWQLFMTGQETLFVINGDAPDTVGAGVVVALKGGSDGNPPNAKYVGPAGTGIEAHRKAIQDEAQNAANAGARLFNSGDKGVESGVAQRFRFSAETASLISIAQASCAGLEKALRYAGRMIGLSDAEIAQIIVKPPATLADREMTPERMAAIMGLWEKALISYETAYENLQQGGVANPDRTWEQEQALIDREDSGAEDARAALPPPLDPDEAV
ncbi:MAG: DUF4055 domain-containing protein [Brevundimonas sp.]|uniref:DUF4055 domain-containing protein n=1 Tax=Brevundimonas sp. TaxID=1871086 RepID=UPI00391BAE29